MRPSIWSVCFVLVTGCASNGSTNEGPSGGGGKADGPGTVPDNGTWTKEVVTGSAELWNGGPVGWGAGTSIAIRASGHPMIAYYDATNRCNNGGFGTYSPDTLEIARVTDTGWKSTIEACGPYAGYWPKMRVDSQDRTHVVFGSGWWSAGPQRANYWQWDAADKRVSGSAFDSAYMYEGAIAMTLDPTDTPVLVSDGALVAADNTKTRLFASDTGETFIQLDDAGTLHVVADTMIPDDATTSTSRLRYARKDASGVTVETPRTVPIAHPLGLVLDSAGTPHMLSWNPLTAGGGELWHSTRTDTGWVDELIASDIYQPTAAMAIGANDELLVVAPGHLYRHAATATSWTATPVTGLSSMSYPSVAIAPDGTLHVAFEIVGEIMSNSVSRASVYHASFH
jgi:hypothetical protein